MMSRVEGRQPETDASSCCFSVPAINMFVGTTVFATFGFGLYLFQIILYMIRISYKAVQPRKFKQFSKEYPYVDRTYNRQRQTHCYACDNSAHISSRNPGENGL